MKNNVFQLGTGQGLDEREKNKAVNKHSWSGYRRQGEEIGCKRQGKDGRVSVGRGKGSRM
jgi:hypothetical protein